MRASSTVEVDASVARLTEVILDFAGYPRFLDTIRRAVVLTGGDGGRREWTVAFDAEIVRPVAYTLRIWEAAGAAPGEVVIAWSLVEGTMMRANEGRWVLTPMPGEGARTAVTYEIRVELPVHLPGALVASLTDRGLPATLAAFKRVAEGG